MNKKINRKEVLNKHLKSENKELRYELAENLENLLRNKQQGFKNVTKQEIDSWKVIKQKK